MRRLLSILFTFLFWAAVNAVAQNKLFPDDLKQGEQSYVYSFIERYFSEISNIKDRSFLTQKLYDDKVFFATGSVEDIKHLSSDLPFALSCFGNRYYEATWSKGQEVVLTVIFPISYELLLGQPKHEIEKTIYDDICAADLSTLKSGKLESSQNLMKLANGLFQTKQIKYYQKESLSNRSYYKALPSGQFKPVLDAAFIEQSATNIFQSDTGIDFKIDVEQSLYGFESRSFTITLRQWLAYCQSRSLSVYAGIEEEYESALKLLIIAESAELGYNHMLSVMVPKKFLADSHNTVFSAKLNAYIPTHNVKDLYQQYKEKTKREL